VKPAPDKRVRIVISAIFWMIAKPVRLVTEQHVIPAKRQQVAPITGFWMLRLADRAVRLFQKGLELHIRHVIAVLVLQVEVKLVPETRVCIVVPALLQMRVYIARLVTAKRVICAVRQQVAPITGFWMQRLADRAVHLLLNLWCKIVVLHLRSVMVVLVLWVEVKPAPDKRIRIVITAIFWMIAKPAWLVTEQHVIPARRQQVAPITGFRRLWVADRAVQLLTNLGTNM
jgi:hypothetical protein